MSRTDMAKLMRARGVRPRRRERKKSEPAAPPSPRLADTFREPPPAEVKKTGSVFQVPDAWEAPKSVQKKSLLRHKGVPEEEAQPKLKPGPKKKAPHKRRKTAISISVSEEEEFYLRKHAHELGLGISEWMRALAFKAMGMPIPPRS